MGDDNTDLSDLRTCGKPGQRYGYGTTTDGLGGPGYTNTHVQSLCVMASVRISTFFALGGVMGEQDPSPWLGLGPSRQRGRPASVKSFVKDTSVLRRDHAGSTRLRQHRHRLLTSMIAARLSMYIYCVAYDSYTRVFENPIVEKMIKFRCKKKREKKTSKRNSYAYKGKNTKPCTLEEKG